MSTPQAPTGGRRTAQTRRGRVNLTTALAVALPLLCAGLTLLVRPAGPAATSHPPTATRLTGATLICPSAQRGDPSIAVGTTSEGVAGTVLLGLGDAASKVPLASGSVTERDDDAAAAVVASGESGPGLLAARGSQQFSATGCRPPAAEQWFTGVGAGANHGSVLELTNPDRGTAIADVTVLGRAGVVDAPRLRGISVPGGQSVRLPLSSTIPTTGDLALQVVAARGRVGATVLDTVDLVGRAPATSDWLAPQLEPATESTLLGLAPGSGTRWLVVANPGDDEARVSVKIVARQSEFAPEGVEDLQVAPHSTGRMAISSAVSSALSDGGLGVALTASVPVTATLRSVVGGDVSHAVPGERFSEPAAVLLPATSGKGRRAPTREVVLGGSTSAGTASVVALDADGTTLRESTIEVEPGRGYTVKLPSGTRQVRVEPGRASLYGAVVTAGAGGASVAPLTAPVTEGLVPDVRPGVS